MNGSLYGLIFIGMLIFSLVVFLIFFASMVRSESKKSVSRPKNETDPSSTKTNYFSARKVQIVLGSIWLLDGLLQLQHRMFTTNFTSQVIKQAISGQPSFVVNVTNIAINIFNTHPAIFNSLIALTQVSLGLLILNKKTVKFGLYASVLWGLVVWSVGEGYGGIFGGHTILLMGAPGAALIYLLLALAVIPKSKKNKTQNAAYWLAIVWTVIWIGGGVYQLLPGQNSVSDISSMLTTNSSGAPGWLANLDQNSSKFVSSFGKVYSNGSSSNANMGMQMSSGVSNGYQFILFFAGIQILIGIGVLFKHLRKASIISGIALSLIFWVVGQSLGGYYTGLATDPNSGPLIVLLGLAILGIPNLDKKLKELIKQAFKPLYKRQEMETEIS